MKKFKTTFAILLNMRHCLAREIMKPRAYLALALLFTGLVGCRSTAQTSNNPDLKSRAASVYSRGQGQEADFKTGRTKNSDPNEKAQQMLNSSAQANSGAKTSISENKKEVAATDSEPQQTETGALQDNNNSVRVFDETGEGEASRYERRLDAEQRAEESALMTVVKDSGVGVYYGFSDLLAQAGKTQTVSVARYLLTFSAGAVSWKRVGLPDCESTLEGSTKCRVRIKGKVVFKGRPDPSFLIINPQMSRSAYQAGEHVSLSYGISHKAFVYIFSVDEEQNAYLVFPNKRALNNEIAANGKIFFPNKDLDFNLVAVLPKGKNSSTEVLHIIAVKDQQLFSMEEFVEESGPYKQLTMGDFRDVLSRLAKLERDQWTMQVIPYQILK